MKTFKNKIERMKNAIHMMGGALNEQQDAMHNAYKDLSNDELVKLLLKQNEQLIEKDTIIDMLENERPKRIMKTKDIELYDILNFHKFNRTEDGKILKNDPSLYCLTTFNFSTIDNLPLIKP